MRALRVGLMQRIVYENTILTHIVAWAAAVPCVWLVGRQYGRVVLLSIVAGMILEGVCKRLHWVRYRPDLGRHLGHACSAALGFAAALREAIDWAGTPFGIPIAIGISPIGLVIADMLLSFGSETNHAFVPERFQNAVYNTGALVGVSAFITVTAFSIGRLAEPLSSPPHLGLQAILTNLVCDTVTALLCGFILSTTTFGGRRLSVPAMISVCLLCSLVFAWLSLFVAFVGTPDALSAIEVSRVLGGLSPSGDRFELGVVLLPDAHNVPADRPRDGACGLP